MAEKLKMCQEKPHLFFIHLLRFLAFSDFSAYRRHHAVSTSYFGEGIGITPHSPHQFPISCISSCL